MGHAHPDAVRRMCAKLDVSPKHPARTYTCVCACVYAQMQSSEHAWRTGAERNSRKQTPKKGSWSVFEGSCARTRSPIASSSIELLYMKMHDNIPANRRPCMGALQTRARAKEDPQEASIHLHCVCRHQLGNKSPHARTLRPGFEGYTYPPLLVRVPESAIADYTPPTIIFEKKSRSK